MIYFNNRNGSSGLTCRLILFLVFDTRPYGFGGGGSDLALAIFSKGT